LLKQHDQFCAEFGDFSTCFERYPDQIIEAMRWVREAARESEGKNDADQARAMRSVAGRVREFVRGNPYLARRDGKLLKVDELTPADFEKRVSSWAPFYQPRWRTQTLRKGVHYVSIEKLSDKEITAFLFGANSQALETVKKARQALAQSGKGRNLPARPQNNSL